jgi:hypothetical protein
MPNSYKMEVRVDGQWSTNNMRYATKAEADEAGKELLSRWCVPDASRAAPSDDPVNARFDFDRYKSALIPTPEPTPAPLVVPVADLAPLAPWRLRLRQQQAA